MRAVPNAKRRKRTHNGSVRKNVPLSVASTIAAVGVLTLVLATWLDAVIGPPRVYGVIDLAWSWVSIGALALLGVRIVATQPRHRVGWIMTVMAFVGGVTTFAETWAYAGLVWRPGHYPGAALADTASYASWLTAFAGLAFLALYFPTGHVPGPRWRFLPLGMAVAFSGAWFGATVQPGPQNDQFHTVVNPAGIDWFGGPGEIAVGAFMFATLCCILASAFSVVVRYRHATGDERAQIRWLMYAVVLVPVAILACWIGRLLLGTDLVATVVLPLALVLMPTAIGLAVLRYRLYDVEYLINRTVLYATLTLLVIGVFFGTTLLVGVAVGRHSPWAVAASTLAAAGAVRPARDRLQHWVNRRFDRVVNESLAIIDGFLASVRDEHLQPSGIESALAEALNDPGLRVGLWLPTQQRFVDVHGKHEFERSVSSDGRALKEVSKADAPLASIDHRVDLTAQPRLMQSVLNRARLGLELARFAAESASQMNELEQSRARLVEATYQERRRLERDLHDGAQQRLVALGLRIRRLQRSMPPSARILEPALDQTVDEIGEAIADLRRLAAGLRPARLDDGLCAALEDLARTMPIPIELAVDPTRAPETIETSAYFVACEGVTNAVKHAGANTIRVQTNQADGRLRVSVTDDGIGGAVTSAGSGLAGLADRVAAHGGRLVIRSPVGHGTILEAELPCA